MSICLLLLYFLPSRHVLKRALAFLSLCRECSKCYTSTSRSLSLATANLYYDGDEVDAGSSGRHTFLFQQYFYDINVGFESKGRMRIEVCPKLVPARER